MMNNLSVNDILSILEEEDEYTIPDAIVIIPPAESANAMTDEDSENSDIEVSTNTSHLPRRILETECSTSFSTDAQRDISSVAENISKRRKQCSKRTSNSNHLRWAEEEITSYLPDWSPPMHPTSEDFLKETVQSPMDAFLTFFTPSFIDHIVKQTNIYAGSKGEHNLQVTSDEIYTVLGILLLSGYHRLPSKRMYWMQDPDCHVDIVSEAMRRNRFDNILRYLHLVDNADMKEGDRLHKIRPIFDFLNTANKQITIPESCSIDESIIPYYGRHSGKQFIRGKPIRFGFKLWCLTSSDGYMIHAEPYCGSSTRLPVTGLGQGGDVVLGLIEYSGALRGTKFYFDNLFTSVKVLEELTKIGMGGTGTLRINRISKDMNLEDKKVFQKKKRGSMISRSYRDQTVVRWNDNNVVTVLSNCYGMNPTVNVSRYSRQEKKKIVIPMPNPIVHYNKNMGGVDLHDQFVANYRGRIRIKKWWWPFFSWAVDSSCVQGWLLFRKLGNEMPQIDFKRQVTVSLLKKYGKPAERPTRTSLSKSIINDVRRDGYKHIIVKGPSKYRRCKQCKNRTMYLCQKCDAPLHPECFKQFHI